MSTETKVIDSRYYSPASRPHWTAPWTCYQCTCVNPYEIIICDVCEFRKGMYTPDMFKESQIRTLKLACFNKRNYDTLSLYDEIIDTEHAAHKETSKKAWEAWRKKHPIK
jgi:hypothetical protein